MTSKITHTRNSNTGTYKDREKSTGTYKDQGENAINKNYLKYTYTNWYSTLELRKGKDGYGRKQLHINCLQRKLISE